MTAYSSFTVKRKTVQKIIKKEIYEQYSTNQQAGTAFKWDCTNINTYFGKTITSVRLS